jgi:CheY-like chemotaxis protein/two-component sensor histidine kinase
MPIDPQTFPMVDVREYLEQTFRHVAQQKGLAFQIVTDTALPATIYTDANRLQQILKNLLSNAFKFTAKGSVEMAIRPSKGPRGDELIEFSVKDSGIGIPIEKQRLIFEAFQQADGTTSRKYGGTGLGLTISREIARLLGGSIEVVSAPNEGSTFTLVLPARYAGAEAQPEELSRTTFEDEYLIGPLPKDASFEGRKILVVDDDIRNIFAINSVLAARAIQVFHAENGRVAIEVLRQHPDVDAILMDTMMPEMDGNEATKAIRAMATFRELPIISLTAKAMKGDREKALEAGATDYVTKPVDPETLLAIIYKWLPRHPPAQAQDADMALA